MGAFSVSPSGEPPGARSVGRLRGYRRWGQLAAGWSLIFAVVHVFWAVGGETGLASSAGEALAASRPAWFVAVGLWGTAALLLLVGGIGVAAAGAGSTVHSRRWAKVGAGLIAAVLLLRSVGVEVLLVSDAGGVAEAVGRGERDASLWVWNPWFLLGGVLFALATLTVHDRR